MLTGGFSAKHGPFQFAIIRALSVSGATIENKVSRVIIRSADGLLELTVYGSAFDTSSGDLFTSTGIVSSINIRERPSVASPFAGSGSVGFNYHPLPAVVRLEELVAGAREGSGVLSPKNYQKFFDAFENSAMEYRGARGPDIVLGTRGDDTIDLGRGGHTTGDGDDRYYASGGIDTVKAGDGDDIFDARFLGSGITIDLKAGTASHSGGMTTFEPYDAVHTNGFRAVVGTEFADVIRTTVSGSLKFGNEILALAGDDKVYGNKGNDEIKGGPGKDKIFGGGGSDDLSGGSEDDLIKGGDGIDAIDGDEGFDTLHGEGDGDSIFGGKGNDKIYGGAGTDFLYGNENVDRIWGGPGTDAVNGGHGNDFLYGGADIDHVAGGTGNDKLFGGPGADKMFGGENNDTMSGGSESDNMKGGSGADTMFGQKHSDKLFGGTGIDRMHGDQGDFLYGGDGIDALRGGNGNDTIFGGNGKDQLHGGKGADILIGGAHRDVFVFNIKDGPGVDRIRDFNRAVDGLIVDTPGGAGSHTAGNVGGNTLVNVTDGAATVSFLLMGVTHSAEDLSIVYI